MAEDIDNIRDYNITDDVSLESILAEYKGSAFIDGEKKTPSEILDRKISSILEEEGVGIESDGAEPEPEPVPVARAGPRLVQPTPGLVSQQYTAPQQSAAPQQNAAPQQSKAPQQNTAPLQSDVPQHAAGDIDDDVRVYSRPGLTEAELQDSIVPDVEKVIANEQGFDAIPAQPAQRRISNIGRGKAAAGDEAQHSNYAEDEVLEEPDLAAASKKFASACNSISLRSFPAALICLFMIMLTFSYESGKIIPFGIGRVYIAATAALMIALLIVMILCIDILLRGAISLARGNPNAETLILFSCVFSLVSGAFSIVKSPTSILAYCTVSALSLTFAAFGERSSLRAITETLKTASSSSEPYGLQAEYNTEIDKSVLKKVSSKTDGFYNSLMHPDVSETAYRYAAPLLLAAALILSAFTVLVKNRGEHFLHILSALLASAAPFSAMLSFSVPFGTVAKAMRKSGAAVAGWGGADDICFSDGACVTDDDLFPPGTLSFSGAELYEGVSSEKAVRYTASLIIASGSGASHLFSEVLKSQNMSEIKVDDFTCYEGGVGAMVRGERVTTGSAAFMNLIGIRIPEDMNMKNALYTAFDNKLVALFIIDYEPRVSVQSALISIIRWRVKLFFAVRDFNITPVMLEQKFKVSLEDFEYVQTRDSYSISDLNSKKESRISAILTREGLVPFAEAVTGGRLLKSAALASTVLSILSAALGVLYMFYMCWVGAFESAKPGNLMLFMLSMLVAVLIVCSYARLRK